MANSNTFTLPHPPSGAPGGVIDDFRWPLGTTTCMAMGPLCITARRSQNNVSRRAWQTPTPLHYPTLPLESRGRSRRFQMATRHDDLHGNGTPLHYCTQEPKQCFPQCMTNSNTFTLPYPPSGVPGAFSTISDGNSARRLAWQWAPFALPFLLSSKHICTTYKLKCTAVPVFFIYIPFFGFIFPLFLYFPFIFQLFLDFVAKLFISSSPSFSFFLRPHHN